MHEDSCALIKEEIRHYKAMEKKILKNAEDVVIKSGKTDMLQFLKSIPGIGIVTALHLLVFFFKFPDANRKQITALAGLDHPASIRKLRARKTPHQQAGLLSLLPGITLIYGNIMSI